MLDRIETRPSNYDVTLDGLSRFAASAGYPCTMVQGQEGRHLPFYREGELELDGRIPIAADFLRPWSDAGFHGYPVHEIEIRDDEIDVEDLLIGETRSAQDRDVNSSSAGH